MTDPAKSLIAGDQQQLALLPEEESERRIVDRENTEGEYTGERLFLRNPKLYAVIVYMLAGKWSIRQIARTLKVHVKTIMGVREREGVAIAAEKTRLSKSLLGVAGLAAEAAQERLEDLQVDDSLRDLMVSAGIAVDKALLLAGEATSRVEVVMAEPSHEEYNRFVAAIEVEAQETGLETETREQKGAAPAQPAPEPAPESEKATPQHIVVEPENKSGESEN